MESNQIPLQPHPFQWECVGEDLFVCVCRIEEKESNEEIEKRIWEYRVHFGFDSFCDGSAGQCVAYSLRKYFSH